MNNTHPNIQTISTARTMQKNALCNYSHFAVGAALQTPQEINIGGFNIESASYGLTMCAERVALFAALAQGHREFNHLVLVTNTASFPCGACRQMLYEFCPNALITIATPTEIITTCTIASLMPHAFAQADLELPKKGY